MLSFVPLPEQERALDLFRQGKTLRVDAYAGTGKTATLRLLATAAASKGLYLAFNRSIALEARQTFPPGVACTTIHSIAFRNVRRAFRFSEQKLTGALSVNVLLSAFQIPETISFRSGLCLSSRSYASILIEATRSFLRSSDITPGAVHVPRLGALEFVSDPQFADFAQQAGKHVEVLWSNMCSAQSALPLGHDGYLKLWAISNPVSQVDYILIDEAQDLNAVLLGVLRGLKCQMVYVGDPYQQIYEWRGAINAMEQVAVDDRVLLSQSFRFGPTIAGAATNILRELGAREPLLGSKRLKSHLARVQPDVILSRSNLSAMGHVLDALSRNQRCHLLGGTVALESLLEDVSRLKAGTAAVSPELVGFSSWKDVLAQSVTPEGAHLRSLVNMVVEYGERTMLAGLRRTERDEPKAQIVCSTAHRSKGREWEYVRVADDFEEALLRSRKASTGGANGSDYHAELRLLYVAITRAQKALELPQSLLDRFGLHDTSNMRLGRESDTVRAMGTEARDLPEYPSPYQPVGRNEPPGLGQ
jgi:AAA domain/UvrD-like helicase C-terminal domain